MSDFELIDIKKDKDKLIITHGQDCRDSLEYAKELRKYPLNKIDGLEYAANIPMAVFFELERQGITKDEKAFKKWLETYGKNYKVSNRKL